MRRRFHLKSQIEESKFVGWQEMKRSLIGDDAETFRLGRRRCLLSSGTHTKVQLSPRWSCGIALNRKCFTLVLRRGLNVSVFGGGHESDLHRTCLVEKHRALLRRRP